MANLYKVCPKNDISGILPGNKRINDPVTMPLNRKEFIKCMKAGEVYAIINGKEILIEELDYDKAESLFKVNNNRNNKPVENHNNDQKEEKKENVNLNNTEHNDKYQKNQNDQSSPKRNNKRNNRR